MIIKRHSSLHLLGFALFFVFLNPSLYADVTVVCQNHQFSFAGEKIDLNSNYEGTLIVTSSDGDINLLETGDPVPQIASQSQIEIIDGRINVETDAGNVLTCECENGQGLAQVLQGSVLLVDDSGRRSRLSEGEDYAINGEEQGVQSLTEPATILRDGKIMDVTEELSVQEKDVITTSEGATLDLELNGLVGLRIMGSSEVIIDNAAKDDMKVKLVVGDIIVNVKEKEGGVPFQVETPTAVAAVRGTQFMARAFFDAGVMKSLFAVKESSIRTTIKKSLRSYIVGEGQAIDVPAHARTAEVRMAGTEIMNFMAQAIEISVGAPRAVYGGTPGAKKGISVKKVTQPKGTRSNNVRAPRVKDNIRKAPPTAQSDRPAFKSESEEGESDVASIGTNLRFASLLSSGSDPSSDPDDTDKTQSPSQ